MLSKHNCKCYTSSWLGVSEENDANDDDLLFYMISLRSAPEWLSERSGVVMMSLRSAPEWLWSAPERLSKQYTCIYISLGVSNENDVSDEYRSGVVMMSFRSAPEWLSCRSGARRGYGATQ